jgi:hypothetical protein
VKRIISIGLIILLLFNVLGFYGVFMGIRYSHQQSLIEKFNDEDYTSLETVTIKIPITIPYAAEQQDYQRVDGEFEHQGEFYRLIKQKLSNDTLYVVCAKDHENKRIHKALADYVKTFTDDASNNDHHQSKVLNSFSKDYISTTFQISSSLQGWSCNVVKQHHDRVFIDSYSAAIVHPPERS